MRFLSSPFIIVKKYTKSIVVVLFIMVIALCQALYDVTAPPFRTKIALARRDLLPANLLPYVHFGFRLFFADMYWIRTIQDFVAWDQRELFFLDYFKNISTLDPKFEHPYLFAIWTVPSTSVGIESLDRVAEVADKGIAIIPTSWKIPYHLGTQYFLFTKSYDKAKEYLKIAAEKEDAPTGVYLNYSSFVINDIKGYRASYDLVKVIYDSTNDLTLKKILEAGLEKELILTMLERGIVAYKTTVGRYPSSVEELAEKKLISLPQAFVEKFTVTINRYNGSFKIEEKR